MERALVGVAVEAVETGLDLIVPNVWPPSFNDALPTGMDGVLVRAGAHVFLTTDGRDILRRARDMGRFSLAVMRPNQLLNALDSSRR
jgi:hypothetical protein